MAHGIMDRTRIVPARVYLLVFFVLIILTVVTTLIAYVDLGPFNLIVAMTVATLKASLVILYFMHVRHSSRLTWLVIAAGFIWLSLLILGTMSDVITRPTLQPPTVSQTALRDQQAPLPAKSSANNSTR